MPSVQGNSPNTVLVRTHGQKVLRMSSQQTNVFLEGLNPIDNVALRGVVPLVLRLITLVCKRIRIV